MAAPTANANIDMDDNSDEEVQHARRMRRTGEHVHQWYEKGLFRKVRLRSEDPEFSNKGLSSHEAFFNVLFCAAYGYTKLDAYLVMNQDVGLFTMYFFAWFSAYKNGAEYALRYNDDDLVHKIFWTFYGFCCMGMLIHTSGDIGGRNSTNFAFALACLHVLLAIVQFRAAIGIPKASHSATWKGTTLVVTACLWLFVSIQLNRSWANDDEVDTVARVVWVLSIVTEWVSYSVFFAWRGGRDMVKISEEYRITKYRTVCIMVLSAVLVGAANGVDPSKFSNDGEASATRWMCLLAFLAFINLKVLVVDVDVYDHADHAITRGRLRRWLWNLTTPFMVMAITAAGSCCGFLLLNLDGNAFHVAVSSKALAAIFIIITTQRELHHKPRPYYLSHNVKRAIHCRTFVDVMSALVAFLLPTTMAGASSLIYIAWYAALTTILVVANLVVANIIGEFSRAARVNTHEGEYLHRSSSVSEGYGSVPAYHQQSASNESSGVIVTGSEEYKAFRQQI